MDGFPEYGRPEAGINHIPRAGLVALAAHRIDGDRACATLAAAIPSAL
jgi:hypothetical protein